MDSTLTKLKISNFGLSLIGAKNLTAFGETTTEEGKRINAAYTFCRDEVLSEHPWTFSQKKTVLVEMSRTTQDDWATATAYAVDDIVYDPTLTYYYKCLVAHTSTTLFATDLAAVRWILYTNWVTSTVYDKGDKVYNSGIEYACLVNHSSAALFATDLTAVKWVATEKPVDMDDDLLYIFYLPTDFLKVTKLSDNDASYEIVGNRLIADDEALSLKYTYSNDDPTLYSPQFATALGTRLGAEVCFNLTQSRTKAADVLDKYEKVDLPRAMATDSSQGSAEEMDQTEWEESRL